ncbi:MAG: hypothetical protein BJ554DRAFT_6783 [Olpidium bornovanus]|uniref:Uncharacterized protein n=1 Tax=Olpidium bornovanus TaxID=278681 RepID=A0A8H7ZXH7_9FUNG|nr:MAG: hypothetical protein BJ554DRAFT_6783 [Olpidium bornovanus]
MESVEAKLASVTTVSATEQRILQADLYSRTENVQKLEAERDSMAFRVARLEADLKLNAKHHAEEREGLREAHEDKVAQLQRQLRSMKDSFDEAESSRLELERKVQALKRHLAEKEAAVAIKEDEFRSTVGRLEMSKRQLEEDREALEKRLASEAMRLVKVEQEAAQKLNDAGATSAGEKRLLEEETSRLRSELRRLNTEYAGNQQENWKQLADAKLTKARLAEKETAVKELKAELDGVKVAHHHWETERARLLAELRDREDQLSALRKEFQEAQSAQAQVVLKKTELASEIGLLREAYENLRKTSQATIEQQMSRITRLEEANARNMQAYDGRDREVERSSKRKEADDAVVDPRVRLGPQLAREAERADLLERQLSREQEKCSQAEARLERLRSQHEEECHLVNRLRVEIAELTAREDSRRKLDTEAQSEKVAKLTATLAVSEKRVQELLGESNDLRQEMTRVEARVEAKVRDSYDGRLRRLVARLDRLHRDRDRMQEAQRENEEGLRNTYERQITALLRDIKRLKAALAEERRAAAAALSKLKEYGRAAAAYATPPPTAAAAAARYPFTATASDAPANTLRSNQEIAAEEPARPPPPPPSDAAERRAAEKKRRDDIVEQRMREREAEFSAREEQVDKHIALLRMQAGVSASGTPPAVDSAADADSINL